MAPLTTRDSSSNSPSWRVTVLGSGLAQPPQVSAYHLVCTGCTCKPPWREMQWTPRVIRCLASYLSSFFGLVLSAQMQHASMGTRRSVHHLHNVSRYRLATRTEARSSP